MFINFIIIKARIISFPLVISMPNYNLKTWYTVIPLYNVGNIPELIFFDAAQLYTHTHTHTHTVESTVVLLKSIRGVSVNH